MAKGNKLGRAAGRAGVGPAASRADNVTAAAGTRNTPASWPLDNRFEKAEMARLSDAVRLGDQLGSGAVDRQLA